MPSGTKLSLADDEVHLFVARPADLDLAAAEQVLPPEEREWSRTFRFDRHRREHVVSRALVRRALSHHLDLAPQSWRWSIGEHGKPAIDPPCGLYFNASNHVDIVVCAVARHHELGVDVEPLARGDEILSVARTVFSKPELAALEALPLDARRDRAVTLWTVKEAYIKALGLGFSAPLLDMTIDLDVDPPVVASDDGWFLDVRDHEDARIAVALRGPKTRPRVVLIDAEG